ncbi:MAG: 50S ribosomal protein L29 [Desulfobulbaceae bacterium]|nr:50S ribosomal protein L29 [Desulfobulbaceae bacterium]HIJ78531.1 50S ribosomal protein L29 [Deltaproteobacteria bacterium]
MKMKDIRELGQDDLAAKIKDLSEEHFKLKFQHGIRPIENTAKLRQIRKDVARIKTFVVEQKNAG